MTDPFIPTGRELDEGVTGPGLDRPKPRKPNLLRRIFGRPANHTGKNLTDVELTIADSVAAKPAGIRNRAAPEDPSKPPRPVTPGDTQPTKPEVTPDMLTAQRTPRTAAPQKAAVASKKATPKATRAATMAATTKPSTPVVSSQLVAAVVTLSRHPGKHPSTIAQTYLGTEADPKDATLLAWWLAADGKSVSARPHDLDIGVPDEFLEVLDHLESQSSNQRLSRYQRLSEAWDRYDQAHRALTRQSRTYPSLEGLITAITALDVTRAQANINYQAPSWNACRNEISESMAALTACLSLGSRPVTAKMPRSRDSFSEIHEAVLSTLCVPSSIRAQRTAAQDTLRTTPLPKEPASLSAFLTDLARR